MTYKPHKTHKTHPLQFQDCFQRQAVAIKPEARYHAFTGCRYHAFVAELFALMHIADVYLDDGAWNRAYAVVQCHRGVRVCAII